MKEKLTFFAVGMSKLKTFLSKLRDKYRLIVISETSFEEKFSFKLSRWNVIMLGATFSVLLAILIVLAITLTPLKTLIPGFSDPSIRKDTNKAMVLIEKLQTKQYQLELYNDNLKKVLSGDLALDSVKVIPEINGSYDDLDYSISSADSLLRAEIAQKEKYNIQSDSDFSNSPDVKISDYNFFCPLKGTLSSDYEADILHFGVDIVASENETIKSILDGVVILSTWSAKEGYVIAIQHESDIISIYKHNSVLLKKTGELVKVGESIAIIGNSGELTNGPHLHFEMWHNGLALNPKDYIIFD